MGGFVDGLVQGGLRDLVYFMIYQRPELTLVWSSLGAIVFVGV